MADPDYKSAILLGKKARYAKYIDLLNSAGSMSVAEVKLMRELELEFSEPEEIQSIIIPSIRKAVEYLKNQGYQATKSSLCNHKKTGLVRSNAAGAFDSKELDRYATCNLIKANNSETENNPANQYLEKLRHEKLETTTRIAQEQLRILERRNADLDKEIDSRIGQELVKREAFFKTYFLNFGVSEAPAFIEAVHGDQQYVPEFIEYWKRGLDAALGNLTRYKGMQVLCTPTGEVVSA